MRRESQLKHRGISRLKLKLESEELIKEKALRHKSQDGLMYQNTKKEQVKEEEEKGKKR